MLVNVNKGNPATFMLKLEGILEDLFVDLCGATTEVPELKARSPSLRLIDPSTYQCILSCSHGVLYFVCVLCMIACTWWLPICTHEYAYAFTSTIISVWSICHFHTGQDEKGTGPVVQELYLSSAYAGEAEGLSQ